MKLDHVDRSQSVAILTYRRYGDLDGEVMVQRIKARSERHAERLMRKLGLDDSAFYSGPGLAFSHGAWYDRAAKRIVYTVAYDI